MTDAAEGEDRAELRSLLDADAILPGRLVDRLLSSADRIDQAAAYECLCGHWSRIQPDLEFWITVPFVVTFLLGCLEHPSTSSDPDFRIPTDYEGARDLCAHFRDWLVPAGDETLLADLIGRIDRLFLAGDQRIRDCIEMGFLEHVLESLELRPRFAHWANHPEMRETYGSALKWGLGHERPRENRQARRR